MRAKETTIAELYEGDVVYVTPAFQRRYTYQAESSARLLDSLLDVQAPPVFLGALVTRELDARATGFRKALLIDGNQRLLTLLVVLAALGEALAAHRPEAAGRLDAACLRNAAPDSPFPFKNLVIPHDRPAFEAIASHAPPPDPRHPLALLHDRAARVLAPLDADALEAAADRALHRFTFVVLALAREDDPYPVFKLFNPQDNPFTRTGRDTYTQFASDPELMDLIAGGESQDVEFKAHAAIPASAKESEDGRGFKGVSTIVRAVAAMLNSPRGGTLLIGVEDNGNLCGVESEYALVDRGKSNWDGYQLYLSNLLRSRLEATNAFLHYSIERRTAGGHDVCLIRITPSDEPVYIAKRLYVRTSAQTLEMLGPDLVDFVAKRFRG